MRGLTADFIADLKDGELKQYLDLVKIDKTLDLEIRENKINIYYRGGRLYEVIRNSRQMEFPYKIEIDKNYAGYSPYSTIIEDMLENRQYFEAIPFLKTAIDYNLAAKNKVEREIQQNIVRENNIASSTTTKKSVARNTDYYIADLEYCFSTGGEPDMIAVRYSTKDRGRTVGRLALIELKFGIGALDDSSGIAEHIKDTEHFLSDANRVDMLKNEALTLFKQKYELGLIDAGKSIESIDDAKPELILMLANVTPNGTQLRKTLEPYEGKSFEHFDLKVAVSSAMGYGLYSKCVLTIDEFFDKYQWLL